MPISIYTDVVSAVETKDMVRLGEKYGATGQQMCVGLDVAARNIIDALATHAQTMDGAEKVFRKVGEFSGTIVDKFENGVKLDELDSVVLFGTGSLNHIVGSQFDAIVEAVKTEAEASHVAAANLVGLTSALILDFLGKYRKKFGLKRDNLTEILRTQKDLTVEPPVFDEATGTAELQQSLGLKPSKIEAATSAPASVPAGQTTESVFEVADSGPSNKTPTEMAVAVANEAAALKKSNASNRSKEDKESRSKTDPRTKAKKATAAAPCPAPRIPKKPKKRRRGRKWLVAVPLALILGGSLYAWQLFQKQSMSLGNVVASVSEKLTSFRSPSPTSESAGEVVASGKDVAATQVSPSESSSTSDVASPDSVGALASTEVMPRSFTGPMVYTTNSIPKPTLNAKLAKVSNAVAQQPSPRDGWVGSVDSVLADVVVSTPSEIRLQAETTDVTRSVLSTKSRTKTRSSGKSTWNRDGLNILSDDWGARSFFADLAQQRSTESYWWDTEGKKRIKSGYMKAGPWQVTVQPRNEGRATYFTYQ